MRQRNPWDHGWRGALGFTVFALVVAGLLGTQVYYQWTKFKFYQRSCAEVAEP